MKLNQDSCKIYRTTDLLRLQAATPTQLVTMEYSKITSYFPRHLPTQECLRPFIIVSNQQAEGPTNRVAKWDKCLTDMGGTNTRVAAAVAPKELSKE